MNRAKNSRTKVLAWIAALLMVAGGAVSASAAEAETETDTATDTALVEAISYIPESEDSTASIEVETETDTGLIEAYQLIPAARVEEISKEESNSKKVLPPKEQKVKAEQEYKTHTFGTLQYQCPASWEIIDSEDQDWLVYVNDHLVVYVSVYPNDELDRQYRSEMEAQVAEYQRLDEYSDTLYGIQKVSYLKPNRNFDGVMVQLSQDGYGVTSIKLTGDNNSIMISTYADKLGKNAAEEYCNKIIQSVKKVPADNRPVIKKNTKSDKISVSGISQLDYSFIDR